MSGFVLPAALLVLLVAAFAVSALWQSSRRLALAIAIALPVLAAGLLLWRGTAPAIDAPPPVAATPADAADAPRDAAPVDVEALVADLERKLEADPSQWEGWVLLGRVRLDQGDTAAARAAFARAHQLVPDNDLVAVGYAETLMRTDPEQRFPPEAVALLERAAQAQPADERALFFLGLHRLASGEPAAAADLWETLLPRLPPDAAVALRQQIAAARAQAGQADVPPPAPAAAGPTLRLSIAAEPRLAEAARLGAIVFVFARTAPDQRGPPVAAKRIVAGDWPLAVTLSDADSVMPTAKLSAQREVFVTARLSLAGNATGAPGDLESPTVRVRVADGANATLTLDRVRQ
jgi:cytochrome c-type biogenesis protein CcmH